MYAVPGSKWDASILATQANAGSPRMLPVRSVQFTPPSRVIQILPSSVPAQITPACTGDSAMVRIVVWNSAAVLS
jgi:hypothetical protein